MPSVHDLPVELLAHIFRSISPIEHRDIRLAHVCSLWRATLQGTPEFWATFLTLPSLITQDDHERSVGLWYSFIDRTRCQPLRLRLEGGDFDLLKTIPEHLPRLSWLHVRWRTANPKDIQRRLLATGQTRGSSERRSRPGGSPIGKGQGARASGNPLQHQSPTPAVVLRQPLAHKVRCSPRHHRNLRSSSRAFMRCLLNPIPP